MGAGTAAVLLNRARLMQTKGHLKEAFSEVYRRVEKDLAAASGGQAEGDAPRTFTADQISKLLKKHLRTTVGQAMKVRGANESILCLSLASEALAHHTHPSLYAPPYESCRFPLVAF